MIALLLTQVIALEGATVHTMQPGAEPVPATVLIEDGEITAVGLDLEIPEEARRIDLSGRHLVPGLIDGMANLDPEHDPLHTAAGVLLLRDTGNDLERIASARMARSQPTAVGPDLFICGLVFDGQPPATTSSVVVRDTEEVDAKLEGLIGWEIDYVATHTGIPHDAWKHLVTAAHEAGMQVWGPQPTGTTIEEIAAAGQDGVFFLDAFLPASPDGVLTDEEINSHASALAAGGVALTPVLRAYARYLDEGDPKRLELLSPTYEMQWKAESAARANFQSEEWADGMRRRIDSQRRLVAALHAAGVALVPGSGSPHPWLMPGQGLHDELAEWKHAGIADADLLVAATSGAARALNIADRYGFVAPGMQANLVVVDDDPREDIAHLRRPAGVLLRGAWYDRSELEKWAGSVREYQAGVRENLDAEFIVEPPDLPEGSDKVLSGTAETRVFGIRTAVEQYAVARQTDGKLAYAMRRKAPKGLGMPDAETTLLQVIDGNQLASFTLTVTSGGSEYRVEGVRIGGQFRVERRVDGLQIDTNSTTQRPQLIDVGSVLPALILAKHRSPGLMNILYFEGMDPAVSQWSAELRPNGLFAVGTPSGAMVVGIRADGTLDRCQRQRGNDVERTASTKSSAFGGPGLALPADRVYVPDEPAPEQPNPAPEEGPTVR
jgi:amidohydrolase family protein